MRGIVEDLEAQRGGFGIGDLSAVEFGRHFGEIGGIDAPQLEFRGESFALAVAFADQPEAALSGIGKVAANHRGEPGVGGLVGMVEHDASRTRGREGQALREIRLPDGPLQPVVGGIDRAGHGFSLVAIPRQPSAKSERGNFFLAAGAQTHRSARMRTKRSAWLRAGSGSRTSKMKGVLVKITPGTQFCRFELNSMVALASLGARKRGTLSVR